LSPDHSRPTVVQVLP
jgi:hypothetical protein